MQKLPLILMALLSLCLGGCEPNKIDQPPDLNGMIIVEAFHHCKKCDSLIGGIHGKGPTKSFDGEGRENCVHEWVEIDSDTFRSTATELYGINWDEEAAYYWNRKE